MDPSEHRKAATTSRSVAEDQGRSGCRCVEHPGRAQKMRQAHIVSLARQAVEVLSELQQITGHGQYVFAGGRTDKRAMSEVAVPAALRVMGFDKDTVTGHGFRATARTLLDEVLGYRPDIIERQLAHAVKDSNGRVHNRTTHLVERTRMMQEWADYLDCLRSENVVTMVSSKT